MIYNEVASPNMSYDHLEKLSAPIGESRRQQTEEAELPLFVSDSTVFDNELYDGSHHRAGRKTDNANLLTENGENGGETLQKALDSLSSLHMVGEYTESIEGKTYTIADDEDNAAVKRVDDHLYNLNKEERTLSKLVRSKVGLIGLQTRRSAGITKIIGYLLSGILMAAVVLGLKRHTFSRGLPGEKDPIRQALAIPSRTDDALLNKLGLGVGKESIAKLVEAAFHGIDTVEHVLAKFYPPFDCADISKDLPPVIEKEFDVTGGFTSGDHVWWALINSVTGEKYHMLHYKNNHECVLTRDIGKKMYNKLKNEGESALECSRRTGIWLPFYTTTSVPKNYEIALDKTDDKYENNLLDVFSGSVRLPAIGKDSLSAESRMYIARQVILSICIFQEKGVILNQLSENEIMLSSEGDVFLVNNSGATEHIDLSENNSEYFNLVQNENVQAGKLLKALLGSVYKSETLTERQALMANQWKEIEDLCIGASKETPFRIKDAIKNYPDLFGNSDTSSSNTL